MRNLVMAMINEYAGRVDGQYYSHDHLNKFSNQELLDYLLELHAEYVLNFEQRND